MDHEKKLLLLLVNKYPQNKEVFYCTSEALQKRLLQILLHMSASAIDKVDQNNYSNFSIVNQDIKISYWFFLRVLANLFFKQLMICIYIFFALFRSSPKLIPPFTLLMEAGGFLNNSDEEFSKFCNNGPILPLNKANSLIIKSNGPKFSINNPRLFYERNYIKFIVDSVLKRGERFALLLNMIKSYSTSIAYILKYPIFVFLNKDLLFLPFFRYLDKKKYLQNVIITTSSYREQPLYLIGQVGQHSKLHMIWYSQNFTKKVYRGSDQNIDLPLSGNMNVHFHWVWTQGFKEYLISRHQIAQNINVVGPILWYLPKNELPFNIETFNVAIFDVTPTKNSANRIDNYYSAEIMKAFVADIIFVLKEISKEFGIIVNIILKQKREIDVSRHDEMYLNYLKELVAEGSIRIQNEDINMFDFISTCDLSIAIPYTSTCYISTEMHRYSIFYDPSGMINPVYEKNNYISFASGQTSLLSVLKEIVPSIKNSKAQERTDRMLKVRCVQ